MSSNLRIPKICQHCGLEFIAKTTTTKFCGDKCAKANYKKRKRDLKIGNAQKELKEHKEKDINLIKSKDFLTVPDMAKLLNCSSKTAYRLVANGRIPSMKLSERKTLIRRSDIDSLFQIPKQNKIQEEWEFDPNECYTINEAIGHFGISDSALNNIIKRFNLQKYKRGKFVHVRKLDLDKILT